MWHLLYGPIAPRMLDVTAWQSPPRALLCLPCKRRCLSPLGQDMAVEYTCGNVSMTVPCGERLLRSTTYLDKTTHQHKCARAPRRST
jgi:hypothetical protein